MAQDTTETYRDSKLASWTIYAPRSGGVSAPYWMGTTGAYGRKVTVLSATKENLLLKIEDYSSKNKRMVSASEAQTMMTYGLYVLGGGVIVGVIGHVTNVGWARSAGASAAIGGSAAVATSFFIKPKESGEDEIVVDTSLPQMPKLPQATPSVSTFFPGIVGAKA